MASKPLVIVAVLFAATLASAVVGYSYYNSYRAIVASLQEQPSLSSVLSRVSSLRYTMTYYNGSTWVVEVRVDNIHRRVNITYMTGDGSVIGYYIIGYSGDSIVYAEYIDPETGNTTSLDIAKIEGPLRTSARVLTTPTGEVGVAPYPGLGPLFSMYTITKGLSIDWLNPSQTQARVRWVPTNYKLGNSEYKAVDLEVIPNKFVASPSTYGLLTRIIAIAVNYKGVIIFPNVTYEAGNTKLTVKLASITLVS